MNLLKIENVMNAAVLFSEAIESFFSSCQLDWYYFLENYKLGSVQVSTVGFPPPLYLNSTF